MTKNVIDLKGNTIQADAFDPDVASVTTEAVVDGEDTVVAAGRTLTQALQDIVDWVDAEFTRTL